MDILSLLVGAAIGAGGIFLWKKSEGKNLISAQEYNNINQLYLEFKVKSEERERALEQAKAELEKLSSRLSDAEKNSSALEADRKNLGEKILENKGELQKLQEQFQVQFENLANKIFEEKTGKFKKDSEKSIGDMLNPLKEQLGKFQEKIDKSFGDQSKEQFSLKEQIERIVLVNEKMNLQTENLTKALKGDVKAQGNWGEIILERILESSGLRRDKEYTLQGEEMGLKEGENNRHQKPDVIVRIPENGVEKHIVIDSKVSLTHYERYCNEENAAEKELNLKLFINSIKDHVKNLESKRYQDNDKLVTPDFVLMFMPIEGAYSLAIQNDADLHNFAWGKKIIIVGPTNLYATLRTVASIWSVQRQNQNADEIARQAGNLYEKIVGFLVDMEKIQKGISDASRSYDEAMNKLATGKGNVIKRIKDIKELGAKTSKELPERFSVIEEMPEIDKKAANQ